jgi:hypothetical protein
MNTPKSGNEFEHLDIAGAEQVKESYRAALQEEPRAIIDDAIRAAARRAVSSGPTSIGKRWFNRWTTPLAAAATVMLTSSVIFMAVRDRPEVAPPIAGMVAAREEVSAAKPANLAKPALESDAADKRADAFASSVPSPAPAIAAQSLQLDQAKEKKTSASLSMPAAPVAAARAQDNLNQVMQSPALPQQKTLPTPVKQFTPPPELKKAAPIAPTMSAVKVLNETKKEAAKDLSATDVSRRKLSDSEATAALTAQATGTLPSPPAISAAGVSAAPPAPPARALTKPATVPEPIMPRADMSPAAPAVAAAPPAAPVFETMEKSPAVSQRAITAASEKSDKLEPADAWIKRMTELKRQEKNKELADEIARFRKRYPSVELPKELTEAQN